jgi:hypothetical protein
MLTAFYIFWLVLDVFMLALLVWSLFQGRINFAAREIRYDKRPVLFWLFIGIFLPFVGCQAVGVATMLLRELGGS